MKTTTEQAQMRFGLLRLIAIYKIGKVVLLLAAAYGVLRMRDASFLATKLLTWFSGLTPARIDTLGLATLAYAAVFAVEGVGLWMRKPWAEWLTTIVTASLIPLELYETVARPSFGKATVLVLNASIVWYLIAQIRSARLHPASPG